MVWGNNLSHNCIGNVLSTPARMALKWLLKVCIAHSARFLLWLSGGTNWIAQFFQILFLNSVEASLSRIGF
jgi:hypothetical protein